jgi:hypothetical protein
VGDNRPDGGIGGSSEWKHTAANVRRHIDPRIEPGARVSRRQWVKLETSSKGVVGVGPSTLRFHSGLNPESASGGSNGFDSGRQETSAFAQDGLYIEDGNRVHGGGPEAEEAPKRTSVWRK